MVFLLCFYMTQEYLCKKFFSPSLRPDVQTFTEDVRYDVSFIYIIKGNDNFCLFCILRYNISTGGSSYKQLRYKL